MGAILSDIPEGEKGDNNCFEILPSLPSLVSGKLCKRQDAGLVIDQVTPDLPDPSFVDVPDQDKEDPKMSEAAHTNSKAEVSPEISMPGSLSSQELESISKMLDEHGVPNNDFILMHPARLLNPAAQILSDEETNWKRPAKRPRPQYPTATSRMPLPSEGESSQQASLESREPTRPQKVECVAHGLLKSCEEQSHPIYPTSELASAQQSAFHVKSNLFVPIQDIDDVDDDDSGGNIRSPAASDSCSDTSIGLPNITLKPRKPRGHDSRYETCGYI
jgi:hypothetical protein